MYKRYLLLVRREWGNEVPRSLSFKTFHYSLPLKKWDVHTIQKLGFLAPSIFIKLSEILQAHCI